MFAMGFSEMLFLLFLSSGGTGIPLGIPPTEEDPVLAKVAPEECTFYLSWAGMATPDSESKNHTEQLLAEQEVQRFFKNLDRAIVTMIANKAGGNEVERVISETAPAIVKAILSKPGAAFVGKVGFGLKGVEIDGGLIVSTGKDTDNLREVVSRLETALGDKIKAVEVAGEPWKEFPMPEGAPRMLWGFRGNYMILGVGEGSIEGILKRVRTEPPAWLTDLRKRLEVPRTSTVMYLNVRDALALALASAPDPEIKAAVGAFGLDNVEYLGSVTGLDETGYVTRTLVATDGKPTGLFSLVGGKPLSAEDLAPIPKDATFAMAARLDANKIFQEIRESVAKVSPDMREEFDEELDRMEEATELNLAEDVLKPLGDCWRVYNSPGDGGLVFTGLTAVVSVRDRDRVAKTLEKIETKSLQSVPTADPLNRRRPRHVAVGHFEFAGKKIYFLNSVGQWMPFAPAWCVTDKELIFSLFPSHVKSYVSRGPEFESIAQVPEVAEQLGADTGPVMLGYQDTRALFKLWYPIVQIAAQFMCSEVQRQGVDFDISMIPSAAAIVPHLHPSTTTLTQTDGAVELVVHQSTPISSGPLPVVVPMMLGMTWYGMALGEAMDAEAEVFAVEEDAAIEPEGVEEMDLEPLEPLERIEPPEVPEPIERPDVEPRRKTRDPAGVE